MKLHIILPILLISVILTSGCSYLGITGGATAVGPGQDALYNKYNPKPFLADWELITENKQLSDMPTDIRKNMLVEGVTDVAFWELKKDTKVLRIWTKHIDDPILFERSQERNYISTGSWRTQTNLVYTDVGIVGLRKIETANDPLMIYISRGQDMIYIYYFNRISDINDLPAYDGTNQGTDQLFLINLTKDMADIKDNVIEDAPEI